jgi:RND family efflux transporter MFP subunit
MIWTLLALLALSLTAGGILLNAAPRGTPAADASAGGDKAAKPPGGGPGGGAGGAGMPAPPPALIRVGQVTQQELANRWEVIGRLKEIRRAVVGTGQQGRVIDVPIEEGMIVEANKTVMASIDQTFSRIELESANARLAQAKATQDENQSLAEQATRDRIYYEELAASRSAKPREVDTARAAEKAALARVEYARSQVDAAKADIERVNQELIRFNTFAPFDGIVVRKWMEVGQWVQKGASIAELISRGKIDAVVDVPERIISYVGTGSDIEVQVDALRKRFIGKVEAIVPEGASAARTFPVKIRLDDQGGKLMPGMSVTAWLPVGEKSLVTLVPRDAVLFTATDSIVWVVKEGVALKCDVTVLFGHDDSYAVRMAPRNAGPSLEPGMQVVVEGAERILFPGQAVVIAR